MAIIQTIRDKYAKWAVVGIALAIIGFLLMDASVGRSRLLSGGRGTVGTINGKKIKFEEFNQRVENNETTLEQGGQAMNADAKRGQAIEAAWNQEISKAILDDEIKKLGITVGDNERADMIGGERPVYLATTYLGQQGQPYDGASALQNVTQIRRGNNAQLKTQLANLLNAMDQTRLEEKYTSLFSNSANVPRWIVESENADNSRIANISFVRVDYVNDPDSTLLPPDTAIKISDEEIMAYVNKHKDKKKFKQTETRSINYVAFSAAPSPADSVAVRDRVASLVDALKNTTDEKSFLEREASDFAYTGGFTKADDIQQVNRDTLLKIPVGGVFGPYLDNTHYVAAKMVDSKLIPDSVTVRHILVATAQFDQNTRQFNQTRDTAEARKFMNDSIVAAIRRGVSFDSICKKYSEDPGSKDSGGVYKNVKWNGMMPQFNDYIFTNPPGSKDVVYTEFGFHYIEVLNHLGKTTNRVVKIAFLAKPIETSPETENEAASKANEFAGKARDSKTFDAVFEKELRPQGLEKGIVSSIGASDFMVGTLGPSRSLIKKIYEAKTGEVLAPEKVGSNWVVATLINIEKEGVKSAAAARIDVEQALRNKKKADIIRKKIGNITTLEAAAAALNKKIESIDSVSATNPKTIQAEYKIFGAAFNPANKGKVVPELIEGTRGVYVLQVHNTATAPVANANVAQNRTRLISMRRGLSQPQQALRESATIKDKRSEYY